MHAFLIFWFIVLTAFVGLGFWHLRKLAIGADAFNERMDLVLKAREELEMRINQTVANFRTSINTAYSEVNDRINRTSECVAEVQREHIALAQKFRLLPQGLTETNWAELAAKLYEHTDSIAAIESKLSDIAEGCEKLDSDLSVVSDDVRECVKLRQSDLVGLNDRITEISDAQEKARRKSGLRNSPAAFESIRAVAESASSRQKPDQFHDDLVAAATGPAE